MTCMHTPFFLSFFFSSPIRWVGILWQFVLVPYDQIMCVRVVTLQ